MSAATATVHDLPTLQAALDLAARGFRVFPLKPDAKAPRGDMTAWPDKATGDAQRVRDLWQPEPHSNVGILTGDGLVVVDLDRKHGVDGVAAFKALAARHGAKPTATLNALTPTGGRHLFYAIPAGVTIANSTGKLAPGVDIKGARGYVVGAGSRIGGKLYRWQDGRAPIAACPGWLLALLTAEVDRPAPASREPHALLQDDFRQMLEHITAETYGDWCDTLWALKGSEQDGLDLRELADEWSREQPKYGGPDDVGGKYEQGTGQRGVGSLWALAKAGGWEPTADQKARLHPSGDAAAHLDVVADESERPCKFRFASAAELMARPPMTWIVKGVLPKAELAVVYGESGSGKSFWLFDMAASIQRGQAWNGRRVSPGNVAWIAAEGTAGFGQRLKAYAKHHGPGPMPTILPAAPNIREAADVRDLIRGLRDTGKSFDMIVVDTLSAATPGCDENSGKDLGAVIANCKRLHAATGALVALIHHSGKDASRGARGWSGLKAAADVEIEVTRHGADRCATVSKLKDGQDGVRFGFGLEFVPLGLDADGDTYGSCVVKPADLPLRKVSGGPRGANQVAVYGAVPEIEPAPRSAVIEAALAHVPHDRSKDGLRTARNNLGRALSQLIKLGLVHVHDGSVSRTTVLAMDGRAFDEVAA